MAAKRKTTTKKPAASAAKKTTSPTTETVVNFNNQAMQDIQSSLTTEAQKAQEKLAEMGRESAEQFSKSADSAGQAASEFMNICKSSMEAYSESGNAAAAIAKDISEEITEYVNHSASESVELSKAFFSCRTLNDVVELQNKAVKNSVEQYFEACSRFSNAAFESWDEIAEPMNQQFAETSEQFSKIVSKK